ncbi:MAG: hypothetical protein FWH11_12970 [Micrococcales bacterium]|nr:hypothetical protein [Micrococcales bacterium]
MVRLEWAPSADNHDIAHEDATHAMSEGRRWFVAKFETSRIAGYPDPSLFVGYARDGVTLLEVMVVPKDAVDALVVYHVMQARPRIVDLARRRGRRKEQRP